ncbi:hypothetical protein NDU88_013056 [Pleurodeles waltl]|uniref:Uncharacterized protein n=1 Tax=Pleurodeles waltl TaxID=8319 RepID=A0AAV7R4J0_PLEWA|nr:hypothetical protein NDU88_013056 [Pleurodeles waltl]
MRLTLLPVLLLLHRVSQFSTIGYVDDNPISCYNRKSRRLVPRISLFEKLTTEETSELREECREEPRSTAGVHGRCEDLMDRVNQIRCDGHLQGKRELLKPAPFSSVMAPGIYNTVKWEDALDWAI